ncbi:MAG: TonB-dependent receptor [Flavobacteriales bacterium]|nr:TonB-dependent receptor [Flavobacteriales bacterium]
MKTSLFFLSILLCFTQSLFAQSPTQTIRGKVIDEQSNAPLIGANVVVIGSQPFIGASTDLDGNFRMDNVPVGRQTLRISYLGYEQREMPNVLVNSGKEMVLEIQLIESIETLREVVVEGTTERGEHLNQMATVSARTFTVEETKRYAGAIDDPARMASSYAGVGVVDGDNDLVIRGNSSRGMLWKMEGIEIPNPNHFSEQGTSGGPISMLNSNMMGTSEFYTGAFPAEYGNGFSGVFDINLRKGNNEKREYSLGVGILGTDLSVEGPFKKGYAGSYLVNYRYSTLAAFSFIGLDIVGDIIPQFQDLSYNIYLPSKKFGTFSLFGLGGSGNVDDQWRTADYDFDEYVQTDMGVTGLTHSYLIGDKTLIKTVGAVMGTKRLYSQFQSDTVTGNQIRQSFGTTNKDMALRINTSVKHKFNAKHTLKTGLIYNHILFDYDEFSNFSGDGKETLLDAKGDGDRWQAYSQWQYRASSRLTFNSGLHYTHFVITDEHRVDPRFGARLQLNDGSALTAGFGTHTKSWDMSVYYATGMDPNGEEYRPNENLKMLQSAHYVLGYERQLTPNIHAKVEAYYQQLGGVPIEENDSSYVSALNSYGGYSNVPMVNKGTGSNYGIELTVERYFQDQFFFMLTSSLFNSTYVGGDGVERNTAHNNNYIHNLQFGKEWNMGSPKHVFGISAKGVWAGGRRTTPILLAASRDAGYTIRDNTRGYEGRLAAYIRPDVQLTYRINGKKASHLIKLDVQNCINRENPWYDYYNPYTDQIESSYQVGILPVLAYKIQF